jgi:hypothetical protein
VYSRSSDKQTLYPVNRQVVVDSSYFGASQDPKMMESHDPKQDSKCVLFATTVVLLEAGNEHQDVSILKNDLDTIFSFGHGSGNAVNCRMYRRVQVMKNWS